MSQFLMDFKRERILDSKLFHSSPQSAFTPTDTYNNGGVLDLSRPTHHRDSIETRKTPSPSNTSSFSSNEGSPNALSHRERSPINSNKISQYSPKSIHSQSNHYEQSYSPVPSEIDPVQTIIKSAASSQFSPNFHIHQHSLALQNSFRNTPSPNLMGTNQIMCKSPHIDSTETNITSTNLNVSASSTSSSNNNYPMIMGRDGKLSRPFKAYPHDPLSIAASFTATDTLLDSQSAEKYTTFRKRMLEQIHAANGGYPTVSNPKMRRTPSKTCASGDNHNIHSNSEILSKTILNSNNNNDITTTNNNIKKYNHIITNNNNNNSNHCNSNDDSDSNNNSNGSTNGAIKDQAYYERRKKNNAAAKKSRDRRRIKEDEIAIRAAFLERENMELRFELASARKQLQLYGVSTMA